MSNIKLSIITLKILQYFSRLSEFIYFNVENKGFISIMNSSSNLYCYYILNEKEKEINEFVLYHYDEVLEMMKTLNEDELEFQFEKEKIIIKDERTIFEYLHVNKELINMHKNLLNLPKFKMDSDIDFNIKGKELFSINKILKSMKMEEFAFIFENGKLFINSINQSRVKNFKKEIEIEDLNIKNNEDFKINMFVSSLGDLNFSMGYRVNVYKKMNLVVLNGIIGVKRNKKIINKEIPFICLMVGKK